MRQSKSNRKKNDGSSLVEALISVTIVSIGSLGLVNLQGQLIQAKGNAHQNGEAMQVAEAKMEALRNYSTLAGYDAIDSGTDSYTGVNSTYGRSWTVTKNTNPDYATVALAVTWTRRDNTTGTISLGSQISRLNPVLSGMAMDNSSSSSAPLSPANAGSSSQETLEPEAPTTEDPTSDDPAPEEPATTTVTTDDGTVLVYDSDNNIVSINGNNAITISGTLTEASGGNSPPGNINYSNVVISASTGAFSNYCSYGETVSDTVSYTCTFEQGFSGSVTVSGISSVKLCASMPSNAYTDQITSLTGQNYKLFKSSKSCSGSTPYTIGSL